MKTSILILSFIFSISLVQAQTFGEWFNQKKTQKKYLIQQIAALEVYKGFLQKGYGIVKDGTNLIGGITRGEFDLHADFFGNLKLVSPEVRQNSRAEDIVKIRQYMDRDRANMEKLLGSKSFLPATEKKRYELWYDNIGSAADKDLEELKVLLTDGSLDLSDDERIKRINAVYISIQAKYGQQKKFSNNLRLVVETKEQQMQENRLLRKMYGF